MRSVVDAAAEFARGIDTASAIRHGVPVAPNGRSRPAPPEPAHDAVVLLVDPVLRN
ncbi:hypothetical protein ACEWX3_07335 [Mycobacterium sp. G7A2]|uniref:hypothetical protein n=1 Tax=Mycobacterium sp. G7A2 TaxID=3317307 RepID=UPI0035A93D35